MTTPSVGTPTPPPARRRRRFTPLALVTGLASALILALSMNSSLAAFTASITNSINTLSTGTLTMRETGPGGTPAICSSTDGTNNAFTCATINKYGGTATPLAPGASVSTTVTITNTGTLPATTFTLAPGTCTQSGTGTATDFCTQTRIVITAGGTTVTPANSTLTSIAGTTINLAAPVAPGATVTFVFTVSLPSGLGNTYQNLTASQPLTFTFTS